MIGVTPYIEILRIGITVWIVVHGPGIEYDDGIFGYEVVLVCEVFRGEMGCPKPKWIAAALDLPPLQHAIVLERGSIRVRTSLIMA